MSLNPKITAPDAQGNQYLTWTPDPTAEGYAFTTPSGSSRSFNPLLKTAKLGRNLVQPVVATVAVLDVVARAAEKATYPTTSTPPPVPSGSTFYNRLAYGYAAYGH